MNARKIPAMSIIEAHIPAVCVSPVFGLTADFVDALDIPLDSIVPVDADGLDAVPFEGDCACWG